MVEYIYQNLCFPRLKTDFLKDMLLNISGAHRMSEEIVSLHLQAHCWDSAILQARLRQWSSGVPRHSRLALDWTVECIYQNVSFLWVRAELPEKETVSELIWITLDEQRTCFHHLQNILDCCDTALCGVYNHSCTTVFWCCMSFRHDLTNSWAHVG